MLIPDFAYSCFVELSSQAMKFVMIQFFFFFSSFSHFPGTGGSKQALYVEYNASRNMAVLVGDPILYNSNLIL